jgi:hypothetical protein
MISNTSAFVSREQLGDLAILTFNVSSSYEMPIPLLTSHVSQFQSVLTVASRLIEMEQSISDEYKKDVLFSEHVAKLQEHHAQEILNIEKQSITEVTSKISPLIDHITEMGQRNSEAFSRSRSEYEQIIKKLEKDKNQLEEESLSIKRDLESLHQKELKQLRKQLSEQEADIHKMSRSESLIREEYKEQLALQNERIEQLNKEKQDLTFHFMEEARKEREKESQEREKLVDTIHELKVRKANSSNKGGDNERDFAELLKNTFGTASDYNLIKKELNAGDHRINWEGARIMFENKVGYTESALRGKDGLPKALKDFTHHTDCNALIFISEDTSVPDHVKPGDIDFSIIDGRPVIFIGHFSKQQDKVIYLITIVIPLLRILLKISRKNDVTEDTDATRLKQVINSMHRLQNNFSQRLNEYYNKLNAYERQQKSSISELKSLAKSDAVFFESSLNCIFEEVLGDSSQHLSNESSEIEVVQPSKTKRISKKST